MAERQKQIFTNPSTRTAGNDPVAGADPGGTHSTHPGQRDKAAPKQADPAVEQRVSSGDRNPTPPTRSPRPPRLP
jgi:hypothetical protein